MPVNSTQRKYFSDVVKGVNTEMNSNAMQFNYTAIALTDATNAGAGTVTTPTIEPMGVPVIYDGTQWVIYNDNDNTITVTSDLPNGAPIAVVVGDYAGAGFNSRDVVLDAGGQNVQVLFRGANNAGVVAEGIDWTAGGVTTSAGNQTAFLAQLEVQGVMVIDNADVITPTYVD